jgi:zinc protease
MFNFFKKDKSNIESKSISLKQRLTKSNRRAPIFISQLWYQVGASNESRPMTGISHMLEHMMFKGTACISS